jgi:diguanylate cyclase (GGDEF)-like protein
MGSFKLRLVTYFMLLSLLPLVAATWAFSEVARRGETGSADARLSTALRVAVADHTEQVRDEAAGAANSLARATSVQRAFLTHNRAALIRTARAVPHSAFYSGSELLVGVRPPALSVAREAEVVTRTGKVIGRVSVFVPLDGELVSGLRSRAGLERTDRFVLVADRKVIAPPGDGVGLDVPVQRPRFIELNGVTYRAIGTQLVSGSHPVLLVGLTPKSELDASAFDLLKRFIAFAVVALMAVGVLAYALGRTIVRSLKDLAEAAGAVARGNFERRVPARGRDEFARLGRAFNDMAAQLELRLEQLAAERGRVRDAIARFGEALAATHDPYALLPVIVGSTVEATGAAGGRLVVEGQELARAGDPETGGKPLAIPLTSEGAQSAILFLSPNGADFTDEARELAHWLGSQASVALENARLHRLVERQASTDGLTELPNRRHFEEALEGEIVRAERFAGSLSLVLADLDDFKQVNDRFGHQAGDDALRAFAEILRATVREIDLPARYGGEEFAVLLPQTDLEGAHRLAERLRRALVSRPLSAGPGTLMAVTASFGVASYPASSSPAALFAAADEALYRAKRRGKNCVVSADAGTSVRTAN